MAVTMSVMTAWVLAIVIAMAINDDCDVHMLISLYLNDNIYIM